MDILLQDLRYGLRIMAKHPGFTAVAVIVLALGIGANTAIFSVINSVLLQSLPYKAADRLVFVEEVRTQRDGRRDGFSFPRFSHLREHAQSFEDLAAYADTSFNLITGAEPVRVHGARVSAAFFRVLGISPEQGRAFLPEEDQPGGSPVVMISYGLWQRYFGKSPDIIGKSVTVDGADYTVVGIAPSNLKFLGEAVDLWMPRAFEHTTYRPEMINRGAIYLAVIGRLNPGVELPQAQAELNVNNRQYQQAYPGNSDAPNDSVLVPMQEQVVEDIRPALLVLLAAVGCVLLIACANIANLLLTRSIARHREVAVRTALGATRRLLIRQMLTESVLLSIFGGALGLLLAYVGVRLLVAASPGDIPRAEEIRLDGLVLAFTVIISVLTGMLFGLAPALLATRIHMNEALKEGSRGGTSGSRPARLRSALVVAEVALAMVLLISAGLLIRSFMSLREVNVGFDARNLLTMQVALPEAAYSNPVQRTDFYTRVLQRIENLPGVQSVGASSRIHLGETGVGFFFTVEGRPDLGPRNPIARLRVVTLNYFNTLGIKLVSGRMFTEHDTADTTRVMLINESMAQRYFSGEDPIGKHLFYSADRIQCEIIGVVSDVKSSVLDSQLPDEMYVPYPQRPSLSMTLVVRTTTTDPLMLSDTVRRQVLEIDKSQPVANVRTMDQVIAESLAQPRFTMTLLGIFAAVALVLASVGIYGVMSYTVVQRTREIGIRLALGMQTRDVYKLLMRQGMAWVLVGISIGLAGAFAATRIMKSLLYNTSTTDPWTFAGVALLLSSVALLACLIPARKATKVDPMIVLRYE